MIMIIILGLSYSSRVHTYRENSVFTIDCLVNIQRKGFTKERAEERRPVAVNHLRSKFVVSFL
ncbi:hypothetical protein CKAN_01707900 [Cinnamomum micranthum f. kanehirae]|uniref:Uncharacterized protein n=1 Tax=Cinnamomum micranthum f. kanehirae TaxID=337451 RepID=A0A3S3MXH3_9MAGN|nr:hypothetical protein CKAN_01707900 [Cinnamomum micranthum f. kanehirae]